MITLILGANGSGKSAWAEQLAVRLRQGRLLYIATMIPYGQEGEQRVKRHREQRREAGFITLELSQRPSLAKLFPTDTVLLEDVANLTANMMFSGEKKNGVISADTVLAEIKALAGYCAHLLAVSIDGLAPANTYDAATNSYIEILCQVNAGLYSFADTVYIMDEGRPQLCKGRQT